jgi:glycyl-tRNA synthetase beta chain
MASRPENGATGAVSGSGPGAAQIQQLPFLLEIGSEELPARFLPPAMADLRERWLALVQELELACDAVETLGAPRRLALLCAGLAVRQPTREQELKGPPLKVAYDAEGRPTRAAEGFARKNGVALEACFPLRDERGEFLAARKVTEGRPASEILADRLPQVIRSLSLPKVMRWGTGDLEYARPLHWLVALHGTEILPLRLDGLEAGRSTRGHRTLADDRAVELPAADHYREVLREQGVIVDPAERRRRIEEGIAIALEDLPEPARWLRDEDLLTENVHLCEHPTPFAGGYDREFFALPPEVIVTALKAHQRYFAVSRPEGGLLPYFLAVRDGGQRSLAQVRRGNERVLRARLSDALFYWRFDQQQPPDEHVRRLATVTWVEGFGSLLDKTHRLERLVTVLWSHGLGAEGPPPAALCRAAHLAKSDQVTEMIRDGKEFTRLEGTMAAHYARAAGEEPTVARALERHYLPRGANDELPGDRISSVLAVAERLDTLAGCWLAGFAPTGTKDPYGLRRQALALLRILLDLGVHVDLGGLLQEGLDGYAGAEGAGGAAALGRARAELLEFVRLRLAGFLVENLGCDPDAVRAVLPVHGQDPVGALAWARAVDGFRERRDFQQLATGFKRCRNILEGEVWSGSELEGSWERWQSGGGTPAGDRFADLPAPQERELMRRLRQTVPELRAAEERRDLERILQLMAGLGPAIDAFFDHVRVNVSQDDLRRRRHGLLREIHALFARYADFGEVAPAEPRQTSA